MIGELIPTGFTYDQGRVEINDSFSGTANLNNLLLDADFSGGTGGGVIYSAGTDLYNIFLTAAGANDITRVQPGLNTYTGGTGNNPTVNISAATLTYLSATTISGGTIYSGSTDLYDIFCSDCGFSGFSNSTGAFSIIENNGSGNIASDSYGFAGGKQVNSTLYGEWARSSGGDFGQYGFLSWYGSTTLSPLNVKQLYLDGGSLSKLFVVPLDSSYWVDFTITSRVVGGLLDGDVATWKTDGMVKNIGGVVTVPVDTGGNQFAMTAKVLDASFLPPGPTVVISAETATSALTVTVIGPDDNAYWMVVANFTKVNG